MAPALARSMAIDLIQCRVFCSCRCGRAASAIIDRRPWIGRLGADVQEQRSVRPQPPRCGPQSRRRSIPDSAPGAGGRRSCATGSRDCREVTSPEHRVSPPETPASTRGNRRERTGGWREGMRRRRTGAVSRTTDHTVSTTRGRPRPQEARAFSSVTAVRALRSGITV